MITESILKIFIDAIGLFINPIMSIAFKGVDLSAGSFQIPSVLMDYVNYLMSSVGTVLPLMIAYWAWRQFKA